MPEPEEAYEGTGRCSYLSMTSGLAAIRESNKDETLYYAAKKMAIPQRRMLSARRSTMMTRTAGPHMPVWMTMMTSEVFLERSSQKKPKTCLAQASGVPAWRHLVAVWHANGHCRRQWDYAHDLGIEVSADINLW